MTQNGNGSPDGFDKLIKIGSINYVINPFSVDELHEDFASVHENYFFYHSWFIHTFSPRYKK
jgi:hypothetical protein